MVDRERWAPEIVIPDAHLSLFQNASISYQAKKEQNEGLQLQYGKLSLQKIQSKSRFYLIAYPIADKWQAIVWLKPCHNHKPDSQGYYNPEDDPAKQPEDKREYRAK